MTDRKAMDCVEAAKKVAGHDAYRAVGGYVCIVDNSTGDEIMFSDSSKKVEAFIRKISRISQTTDAEMERAMIHF